MKGERRAFAHQVPSWGVAGCRFLIAASLMAPSGAWSGVTLDGSMGAGGSLQGPNYQINADLGRQLGSNLFHSFATFNIGQGESASFNGPESVSRIIGRVTGGSVSSIDGLLRSTIPGADLLLINPSGVVFGAQASVDVGGSFHVATAQQIRFADGSLYSAANPSASSLTTASPEAFGFLGGQGSISLSGSRLAGATGGQWTLSAGEIRMSDSSIQNAGGLRLEARTGVADVSLGGSVVSGGAGGVISLAGSSLVTDGDAQRGSGLLAVSGGAVTLQNSLLSARNAAAAAGGELQIKADGLLLDRGRVTADNLGAGSGAAIRISAGDIDVNAATISANTSAGQGAAIVLEGSTIDFRQGGNVVADAMGAGSAGNITVVAGQLGIAGSGSGLTAVARSVGAGGNIQVDAGQLRIEDNGQIGSNTLASTPGGGKGGEVTVMADRVSILGGGSIQSISQGTGDAGNLSVTAAESLVISGFGQADSGLYAQTRGQSAVIGDTSMRFGNAGNLTVSSPDILIDNNGVITASTLGAGDGGSVSITAQRLVLETGGHITARARGRPDQSGKGGSITVDAAESIAISGQNPRFGDSGFVADTNGNRNGGNINLRTGTLSVTEGGQINARAESAGNGGSIIIMARNVELDTGGVVTVETAGAGAAGNLQMLEADTVMIDGGATVTATTSSIGAGGSIRIESAQLDVRGNGQVIASTTLATAAGGGQGGAVTVVADGVALSGGGNITSNSLGTGKAGDLSISAAEQLRISGFGNADSGLYAQTRGQRLRNAQGQALVAGNAGNLTVSSPDILVDNNGVITASTLGEGNGGSIGIDTTRIQLLSGGHVTARALGIPGESGIGGGITVTAAESIEVSGIGPVFPASGFVADTNGPNRGGDIVLRAPRLEIGDRGQVNVRTTGSGRGGSIVIDADEVAVDTGASVNAGSTGTGAGGDIRITGTQRIQVSGQGSRIAATASGAGQGGDIRLSAPLLSVTDRGGVAAETTRAAGGGAGGSIVVEVARAEVSGGAVLLVDSLGSGKGGDLQITASDSLELRGEGSSLSAVSHATGDGGDIRISAGRLRLQDQGTVSAETRQIQAGAGRGGSIEIESGEALIETGAGVVADSGGAGRGGDLSVSAARLRISGEGSGISASSTGTGAAGAISIAASRDLVLADGGQISTQTTQSDGGNIDVQVTELVYLNQARITTSVAGGAGNGGNITIDPRFVVLNGSSIIANAFGGNGGNILIVADNFVKSVDSTVDASSQLGISGNIEIDAPNVDIGAALAVLPADFIDASRFLRAGCAAGAGQRSNSFLSGGRGGLPPSSQGPLFASGSGEDAAGLASVPQLTLALGSVVSCEQQMP